jgi:hypothetical protein
MNAAGHLGRWKPLCFAKNIESILLPVYCPTLFKRLDLLGVDDAESYKR